MALFTAVNSQITDSITQANTKVLGDAPATAMGNLFVVTSQSLGNAAHNATTNIQQVAATSQAAMSQGISTLLSIDTASAGRASVTIFGTEQPPVLA